MYTRLGSTELVAMDVRCLDGTRPNEICSAPGDCRYICPDGREAFVTSFLNPPRVLTAQPEVKIVQVPVLTPPSTWLTGVPNWLVIGGGIVLVLGWMVRR